MSTTTSAAPISLEARGITVAYDRSVVIESLQLEIAPRSFTVIIGPNACGKSTLLRSLARLLKPSDGGVLLEGADLATLPTKAIARKLGLLPQTPLAPDGITVSDLVGRGRYPHQRLLARWSEADERAVNNAMLATRIESLADFPVDELSGGQRQRAWVAMTLAQEASVLLLDEPTTYLDVSHQYELLDLCNRLREQGRTIVAVLHDLNQAARFATDLVVMHDGAVVATGTAREVLTQELVETVFALPCIVIDDPISGTPMVVPR
ncbi:MAG: ABC transporter ATP-binding protein [Microbacteriaceae bacterium]|uniref:ABC transporter ATP-binding protein n=1 Tax=Microbacteriaceae TaxID=85023 RepID=UPI00097EFD52|nr:ABC transporter ATP-binding protein [Microbacterium sp. JB110]RCS62964.1 ABC transporter ATP-binding protein [Microbacterium sp. JB110]SJM61112.1 ABC-type Fe3+-siderophore transport system, ATPase component [Frigoribacterium sp. JB110]